MPQMSKVERTRQRILAAAREVMLKQGQVRDDQGSRAYCGVSEGTLYNHFAHKEVLPWDQTTAQRYGTVRAEMERRGRPIISLDLLIAAHALAADAVLVTSDRAFSQVAGLRIEDWTAD
jgi:AcrR family transcriptional regulator